MINEIINAAKTNYVETLSIIYPKKELLREINETDCVPLFKQYLNNCDMSSLKQFYKNRNDYRIGSTMLLIWILQSIIIKKETGEDCESAIVPLMGLANVLVDSPFSAFYVGTVLGFNMFLQAKYNYELPSFLLRCCA